MTRQSDEAAPAVRIGPWHHGAVPSEASHFRDVGEQVGLPHLDESVPHRFRRDLSLQQCDERTTIVLRAGFETTRQEKAPGLGDEQNVRAFGETGAGEKTRVRVGDHECLIHLR